MIVHMLCGVKDELDQAFKSLGGKGKKCEAAEVIFR